MHARVSHSVLVTMRLLKMEKCIFLGGPVGVGWWTSAALITSVQTEPKPDPERFYSNNKRMCRKVQLMWELKGTSVHFTVALFPLIVKTSQLPQFLLRSEDLLSGNIHVIQHFAGYKHLYKKDQNKVHVCESDSLPIHSLSGSTGTFHFLTETSLLKKN